MNKRMMTMMMESVSNMNCLHGFFIIGSMIHQVNCMLSTNLGEDQMLAVVCIFHSATRALENYQNGNVNCASALDILPSKLRISINGRYLVICLEYIRIFNPGNTLFYSHVWSMLYGKKNV
ncbi:uncharacterized protein LOC132611354 isoform X2 [Lycium barbarum]|uniref:uncharacterized protein LOC132611354 isoform X2 n=2 Tax=Lycium barbarum TaxID=112863 RepID=UPI00293F34AB|nr:uncharacterized protein LOC132611354 isoform X2 [Lycium barbarum]